MHRYQVSIQGSALILILCEEHAMTIFIPQQPVFMGVYCCHFVHQSIRMFVHPSFTFWSLLGYLIKTVYWYFLCFFLFFFCVFFFISDLIWWIWQGIHIWEWPNLRYTLEAQFLFSYEVVLFYKIKPCYK